MSTNPRCPLINNRNMTDKYTGINTYFLFLVLILLGCNPESPSTPNVEKTVLESFETLVDMESNTLAVPTIIKADSDSGFYVYDLTKKQVFRLDENGRIKQEIGRAGRGPGEYSLFVRDLFVSNNNFFH